MKTKVIQSLKWNSVSSVIRLLLQSIATIILTRLLDPEDYGILAVALTVVVLGNLINEFGIGKALIQKQSVSEMDIRFVFTVQMLLAFILTSITFILAPYISMFFDNESVELVLKVISLIFIFQALGLTSNNLIQRNMDFKTIQIISLSSYTISYIFIGITMAYYSFGVWSLVAAQLSHPLLNSILSVLVVKHSFKPLLFYTQREFVLSFGLKSLGNNIVNWGISNVDTYIIGHFTNVNNLGFYNRSNALILMPTRLIADSLKPIMFSYFSKVLDDKNQLRKIYFGSVSTLGYLVFPILLTFSMIPETIVDIIFGSKWISMSYMLTPLSIAILFRFLASLPGPLIWGSNKGELEVKAQMVTLVVMTVGLLISIQFSYVMLLWTLAGVNVFRFVVVSNVVVRLIEISWINYLKVLLKPMLLAILTGFGVFLGDIFYGDYLPLFLTITLNLILGLIIYFSLIFRFSGFFIDTNLSFIVKNNLDHFPKFMVKSISRYL